MLVLIGPSFAGSDAQYQLLSELTGMVAYDLRSRAKPGAWGLLKVLADETEAERLRAALVAEGFPVVVVHREVVSDKERPIVALRKLEIEERQLKLQLSERSMVVPVAALCSIVRGEVQVGKARGSSSSSATFRAVVPDPSDHQVFRESMPNGNFEAFAAVDLHFHSVTWVARIDARAFDFLALGIGAKSPVSALDTLADRLGLLAGIRVDRAARGSSISGLAQQAAKSAGTPSSPPSMSMARRAKEVAGDDRFDSYSRVIGEAERLWAAALASAQAPGG